MSTTWPLRELLPIIVVSKTEGKITKCWLVNKEGTFFLNFGCEESKITDSLLTLRLPSNHLCYREVVAKKIFYNNGVLFRNSGQGIHQNILRQERKWKHEEKDRVLEELFQKVGKWKKLPSKFRRVQDRRPPPLPQFRTFSFKHSVIMASMLLTSTIAMAPRQFKDYIHLCFQK